MRLGNWIAGGGTAVVLIALGVDKRPLAFILALIAIVLVFEIKDRIS